MPETRRTAFQALAAHARTMQSAHIVDLFAADPARARMIADFIAGMSDRFAMQALAGIQGAVPEGLVNV